MRSRLLGVTAAVCMLVLALSATAAAQANWNWRTTGGFIAVGKQVVAQTRGTFNYEFVYQEQKVLIECPVTDEDILEHDGGTAHLSSVGNCIELRPTKGNEWTFSPQAAAQPPSVSPEQGAATGGESFAAAAGAMLGDAPLVMELTPLTGGTSPCKIEGDLEGNFNNLDATLESRRFRCREPNSRAADAARSRSPEKTASRWKA